MAHHLKIWTFLLFIILINRFMHSFGHEESLVAENYTEAYQDITQESANSCIDLQFQCSREKELLKTCNCSTECSTVFHCCNDQFIASITEPEPWICRKIDENHYMYMISGCKNNWNGSVHIKEACLNVSYMMTARENWALRNPYSVLPVTSLVNQITYINAECAICNDEQNFQFWKFELLCEEKPTDFNEVAKNMAFSRKLNQWGYVKNMKDGIDEYISCSVKYSPPNDVSVIGKVHFCGQTSVVSDCPVSWKKYYVRELCWTLNGVVNNGYVNYKNVFCAICNGEDYDLLTCGSKDDVGSRDVGPLAVAFDVSEISGSRVGKVAEDQKCLKNQIFDVFVKKCRDKICGKDENENCVK